MSDIKNICEIGSVFASTLKVDYLSNNTFIDFDAIILSFRSINGRGEYSGILKFESSKYIKDYMRRKGNLIDFLIHKQVPLVLFAPEQEVIKFYPKNIIHLCEILPVGEFEVIDEKGVNLSIIKNTIFTDFFEKNIHRFNYKSFFEKYSGIPILETPHTKKVLAYFNKDVVFLPNLIDRDNEITFLEDLFKVLVLIRKSQVNLELPSWADSYYLPTEKNTLSIKLETEVEIKALENKLAKQNNLIESIKSIKQMFTGTGNSLENEIFKVFTELGFEIVQAEINRDDLIVKYDGKVAVIEVKGVVGTGAEKQAAQLEKWVTSYYEKFEVHPKGILIVNAFKDKPLNERDKNVFPHQMLKFSEKREHCLISTIQLLGLFYKAKESEEESIKLINSLFDTVGVYDGFSDWEEFIEYSE